MPALESMTTVATIAAGAFFSLAVLRQHSRTQRLGKPRLVRIGILKCPGSFDFAAPFVPMLEQILEHTEGIEIQTEVFVCAARDLPGPNRLVEFDGFIITGSKVSVHDTDTWVVELKDWIREARHTRQTKICGICFGHELVAHALGGRVEENTQGWEIGVAEFDLLPEYRPQLTCLVNRLPGRTISSAAPTRLRLLCTHGDHVTNVPAGFSAIGGSAHTPIQAMLAEDGQMLCYQSHPEFTRSLAKDVVAVVDQKVGSIASLTRGRTSKKGACSNIDGPLDAEFVGATILGFFLEPQSL